MASFYAELHLAGSHYRVVHCAYSCSQLTGERGRPVAKVRHNLLHLTLDVAPGEELLSWAAAAHKPLSGEVVFYDTARLVPNETIAFTAGECVGYQEQFMSGASGDGAYVCHIKVAASAFELRSGGPAAAVQQAQRVVKEVQQKGAVTAATGAALAAAGATPPAMLRESLAKAGAFNQADPSTHFVRPASAAVISPAVMQLLSSTINLTSRAVNDGPAPAGFKEAVMADLQTLYETPTGRKLLESLQASGKRIELFYGKSNGAAFPNANPEYPHGYWPPAFYAEDGITPGAGTAMGISYNPFSGKSDGASEWLKRPPAIGLAHELIHAEQAAYGRMRRGDAPNGDGPDPNNPKKLTSVQIFELEAVGVPPHDKCLITENKLRAEWNPPQPRRRYY